MLMHIKHTFSILSIPVSFGQVLHVVCSIQACPKYSVEIQNVNSRLGSDQVGITSSKEDTVYCSTKLKAWKGLLNTEV